jgi:hypothetical protein
VTAAAPLASGALVAVPGWHLDPYAPSRRERFWDEEQWTRQLRYGSVFPGRTTLGPGFFTLAAWLRGLFYVQVAVSAVGAIVAVWVVSVLNRWLRAPGTITVEEGHRIDLVDLHDGIRSAMGATGPDRKRWLVRTWWAAFLTMSLLDSTSQVVDRTSGSLEGLDGISSMRTLAWLSFGSSLAAVTAAALAALLVRRLTSGLRPVEYLEPAE